MDEPLKSALNSKDAALLSRMFASAPDGQLLLAELLEWQPPSGPHATCVLQALPDTLSDEFIARLEARFILETQPDTWFNGIVDCAKNAETPRERRAKLANAALASPCVSLTELRPLANLVTNKNLADIILRLQLRTDPVASTSASSTPSPFSARVTGLLDVLAIRAAESPESFLQLAENRPTLAGWIMTRRLAGMQDSGVPTIKSRLLNQIFDNPTLYDWEDRTFTDTLGRVMAQVLPVIGTDSAHTLFERFDAFHRTGQRLHTVRLCETLHHLGIGVDLLTGCIEKCNGDDASLTRLLLAQGNDTCLPLKIQCLQKASIPALISLCPQILTTTIRPPTLPPMSSSSSAIVPGSLAGECIETLCRKLTEQPSPDMLTSLAAVIRTLPSEWQSLLVDAGFQRFCTRLPLKAAWLQALAVARVEAGKWLAHCPELLITLRRGDRQKLLEPFDMPDLRALYAFLERTDSASEARPYFAIQLQDFTPDKRQAIILSHPDASPTTLNLLCEPLDDAVFLNVVMYVAARASENPAWSSMLDTLALLFCQRLDAHIKHPEAAIHAWKDRPEAVSLARRVLELKPCLEIIGRVTGILSLRLHPVSVFEVLGVLPATPETPGALALCWLSIFRHSPKALQTLWDNLLFQIENRSLDAQQMLQRMLTETCSILRPDALLDESAKKTLVTGGLTLPGTFDPLMSRLADTQCADNNPRLAAQYVAEITDPARLPDYPAHMVANLLLASLGETLEKNWATLQTFAARRNAAYHLTLLQCLTSAAAGANSPPLNARIIDFLMTFDTHASLVADMESSALVWLMTNCPLERLRHSLHGWLLALNKKGRLDDRLAVDLLRPLPDDARLSEEIYSALVANPVLHTVFVELGQQPRHDFHIRTLARCQLAGRSGEEVRMFLNAVLTNPLAIHLHTTGAECIAQMMSFCVLNVTKHQDTRLVQLYLQFLSGRLHMTAIDKQAAVAAATEQQLLQIISECSKRNAQWVNHLVEQESFGATLSLLLAPLSPEARLQHTLVGLLQQYPGAVPHPTFMQSDIWQQILLHTLQNPTNMLQSERFMLWFEQLSPQYRTFLADQLLQSVAVTEAPYPVRAALATALTPARLYEIFSEQNAPDVIAEVLFTHPDAPAALNDVQKNELLDTLKTSAHLGRMLDNLTPSARCPLINTLFDILSQRDMSAEAWLQALRLDANTLEALCHATTRDADKQALAGAIHSNPCLRQFLHASLLKAPGDIHIKDSFFADSVKNALNAPWKGVAIHPAFLTHTAQSTFNDDIFCQWHTLTAIHRLGTLLEPMSNSAGNTECYQLLLNQVRNLPQVMETPSQTASSSMHGNPAAQMEQDIATHCSDARLYSTTVNPAWLTTNLPLASQRHTEFLDAHALTPLPRARGLVQTLIQRPDWKNASALHTWFLNQCLAHPLWDGAPNERLLSAIQSLPAPAVIAFSARVQKAQGFITQTMALMPPHQEGSFAWLAFFAQLSDAALNRAITTFTLLDLPVLGPVARLAAHVRKSSLSLEQANALLPKASDDSADFFLDWLEADIRHLETRVRAFTERSDFIILQGLLAHRNDPHTATRLACMAEQPACLDGLSPRALAQCLGSYLDSMEGHEAAQKHCISLLQYVLQQPEQAHARFSAFSAATRGQLLALFVANMETCEPLLRTLIDAGFKDSIQQVVTNALKRTSETDLDTWMPLRRLQLYASPPTPFDTWLAQSSPQCRSLRHQFVTDVSLFDMHYDAPSALSQTDENLQAIAARLRAIAWIKADAARRGLSYLNHMSEYAGTAPVHEPVVWYRWLRFAQLFADNPQETLCDGLVHWILAADSAAMLATPDLSGLLDEVLAANGLGSVLTALQNNSAFNHEKQVWFFAQVLARTQADDKTLSLITRSCSVPWLYEQCTPGNPNRDALLANALRVPRLVHAILETPETQRTFLQHLGQSQYSPAELARTLADCVEPRLASLLALHLLGRVEYIQMLPSPLLIGRGFSHAAEQRSPLTPLAQRILPQTLALTTFETLPPEAAITLLTAPHLFHVFREEHVLALFKCMGEHQKDAIGYWLQQGVLQPNSMGILAILLNHHGAWVCENIDGFMTRTIRRRVVRESLLASETLTHSAVETLVNLCDEQALQLALDVHAHRATKALRDFIIGALKKLPANNPLQPHTLVQLMRLSEETTFSALREMLLPLYNANLLHFAAQGNVEYLLENGQAPLGRLTAPVPSLSPPTQTASSSTSAPISTLFNYLTRWRRVITLTTNTELTHHPIVTARAEANQPIQAIDYFLIYAQDTQGTTTPLLAHYFNLLQTHPNREEATQALHQTANLLREQSLAAHTKTDLHLQLLQHPQLIDIPVWECLLSNRNLLGDTLRGLGGRGDYQRLEDRCTHTLSQITNDDLLHAPLTQARDEAQFERTLSEMGGFLVGLRRFFKRWWHDLFAPARQYVTRFDEIPPLPEAAAISTAPATASSDAAALVSELEAFELRNNGDRERHHRAIFENRINLTPGNPAELAASERVQANRIHLAGLCLRDGHAAEALQALSQPCRGDIHQKAADMLRQQPLPELRRPVTAEPLRAPPQKTGFLANLASYIPSLSGYGSTSTQAASSQPVNTPM